MCTNVCPLVLWYAHEITSSRRTRRCVGNLGGRFQISDFAGAMQLALGISKFIIVIVQAWLGTSARKHLLIHTRENPPRHLLTVFVPVLPIFPPALLFIPPLAMDQQHRKVDHEEIRN